MKDAPGARAVDLGEAGVEEDAEDARVQLLQEGVRGGHGIGLERPRAVGARVLDGGAHQGAAHAAARRCGIFSG